ncbi:ESPR-type extended signal peptide-containing protein [Negativicoccus succinicivorans]|uniref:ESPR-type extended signal peptide-containing protein n=1 Tax=Negativicoccus succinicivorans TaxID=620903 RepID=UPI0028D632E5|nr:ESPR-type extended signal peptide-containing protein [Negativicoccus succinicivorans]
MNKIYKIIWSKAVGAYVVTSELAKSHTKSPSGKGLRRSVTAALLAAMVAAPVAFGVYAAEDTHYVSVNSTNKATDSNYDNQGAQAENSIAIGPSVKTTGEDNIVIGSGELGGEKGVTSVNGQRVLVVGHGNYFQPTSDRNGKPVSYRDSAIIGHDNKLLQGNADDAGGGTPAYQIIHGWKNTLKGSFTGAIGYENEIKNSCRPNNTSQNMAFAIGTENTIDATGYYMGDKNRVNTLPDYKEPGSNPNTVGADLYVVGRHNIIGSSKSEEWYVSAGHIVGSDNVVYSNNANVFGDNNKVYFGSGIAIGNANKVGIDNAGNLVKNKDGRAIYNPVAVGHGNIVTGNYGVALGVTAESKGKKATAVGSTAQALSDYSAAMGSENRASGYGSVAVGSLNNKYAFYNPRGQRWKSFDSGDSSSAVGVQNISTGEESNAVGYQNISAGAESSAVGVKNKTLEEKSSSFGYLNVAAGKQSSAFGYSNQATEAYGFAAGSVNYAGGQYSTAVGGWNQAEGKKSQAVGYKNFVSGYGAVSIGSENNLNFVKQYQALGFVKTGDLSSALGISNTTAGRKSMGIGSSNYAFGTKSAGIGMNNYSMGYETLAIGHYAVAGSEDPSKIDQVKYAAAIGNRARSTITDAVAIGSFSNTTRDKGDYGYNPALGKAVTDTDITDDANIGTYRAELEAARVAWQESMEKAEDLLHKIQTGQFANQAEYQQWGAEYDKLEADADAKLEAYHEAQKKVGALVGAWQGQMAALSVGDEATGRTRQITGVAAGSADTDAVNVAQLKAIDRKLAQGAVHYYSVTSDKKAAGSNFDNDGAKAADSMVIGIGSTSEAVNSTVIGNNNTLTGGKRDSDGVRRNNSIVVGENIEVDGTHNAVFGTDYRNGDNKLTKVAGDQNTVIGVGNLVGYTAKVDPADQNAWIYTKNSAGSDQNVAVGLTNTVNGGSIAIGTSSEVTSLGTSVGHGNTIISSEQYGLALGNKLIVDGYQSIAVGSESKATADWATAIGQEAIAEKEGSVAIGMETKAITINGVALGSYSVADRAKGAIGYLAGDKTSKAWKSNVGALSIGGGEYDVTRQITGVAAGSEDTDAVNVAQLKAVQEIAAAKTTIEAGDNIKVEAGSAKGSYKISATNTYTTGGTYDAVNKKITFTRSDNQTYDVNLADFAGNVTDTRNTIANSDTVTVDDTDKNADGSINYKLNVKTDGKVAKNDKGIVTGGTVYNETRIEKDGNYIKAENTAGQNLIALDKQVGANTTNIAELNNRVYDMGNRVDRVGAGAAALAGLHPLDFDPDDKWDFAASYGNYKGAHALAIGAFYRPNESKMFSVGGSFGGGENMLNIGFSMKVGRGNEYMKLSRSEMAKQLDAQAKKLDEQAQKLDAQTQKLDAQDEQIRDMQAEMKAITQKLATLQARSGK